MGFYLTLDQFGFTVPVVKGKNQEGTDEFLDQMSRIIRAVAGHQVSAAGAPVSATVGRHVPPKTRVWR